MNQARDRLLLFAATVAFVLWLASIGPLRTWARGAGHGAHWAIGVAPSFFAGLTFVLWQAFITRTSPLVSTAYAVILIVLAEMAQLFLPRYTADVRDIAAGVAGAGLGAAVLLWRAPRLT